MVPPSLLKNRTVDISMVIGFAFMVIYYGLPFVLSIYFQQQRGLSALATGVVFLPMMLIGTALTPFVARVVERTGARVVLVSGLAASALGAVLLACMPLSTPIVVLSALMILVGFGGPTITPPTTGVLLNSVQGSLAGTASGVFNTSRQVGGALAVAVFGGLLAGGSFGAGRRSSLLIAAAVAIVAAFAAARLRPTPVEETI
jgi:sugar phosphate permease